MRVCRTATLSGKVEYVEYYGMTMLPTLVVGNGTVAMKASIMDRMLLFYADRDIVKDIPLTGEAYWYRDVDRLSVRDDGYYAGNGYWWGSVYFT